MILQVSITITILDELRLYIRYISLYVYLYIIQLQQDYLIIII